MTDTSARSRQPAGVTAGGQFATEPKGEADISLAAPTPPVDAEVAFRNPRDKGPRWMRGTVVAEGPAVDGQINVFVDEYGYDDEPFAVSADELLLRVDPSSYDGDDVDSVAEAFEWTDSDWADYYEAEDEREDDRDAYFAGSTGR